MPVTFSERRLERGIHIFEDRYKSGHVEIGFYASADRRDCLAIVERQPGTIKWHFFGRTGSRPLVSGRSKAAILQQALVYACEQRAIPSPANHGNLETL